MGSPDVNNLGAEDFYNTICLFDHCQYSTHTHTHTHSCVLGPGCGIWGSWFSRSAGLWEVGGGAEEGPGVHRCAYSPSPSLGLFTYLVPPGWSLLPVPLVLRVVHTKVHRT